LVVGCVNACSAAPLSRAVVDERLDVLVITETWHEGPESTTLKRIATPGYQEAARPISPDAVTNTVDFQNHGGSYPVLKVGADTAVASGHVRLLGDDISLDLSVDRHVSRVCAGCFCKGPGVQLPLSPKFACKKSYTEFLRESPVYLC